MLKHAVTAAAIVAKLLAPLAVRSATALPAAPAPAPAPSTLVHKSGVFCGPYGCGHIHYGPRHRHWRWGPSGYNYRPACPTGYYYACRTGPLGYGQCACWPYRPY
jgi:hypothetical protein